MKLTELLSDDQLFHSDYQIRNFIVGKGGTPYGQYKQAVRELAQRVEALRGMAAKSELLKLKVKELKIYLADEPHTALDKVKHAKHKLELDQEAGNRAAFDRAHAATYREFTVFYKLAAQLKKLIGDLSNGQREKLESRQWKFEARRHLAMDMMTAHTPSRQTWDLILSLELEDRRDIIADMNSLPIEAFPQWLTKDSKLKLPPPPDAPKLESLLGSDNL